MGYRSFVKGRKQSNLRTQDQKLNETTSLDIALSLFKLIPESQFDQSTFSQTELYDNISTNLLEFIGIDVESFTGLENIHQNLGIGQYDCRYERKEPESTNDPTLVFEKKMQKIKQQLTFFNTVTSKIEKNLFLNNPPDGSQSKEELDNLRLQAIQEDQDAYFDLDQGRNYQLDQEIPLLSRPNRRLRPKRKSIKSQTKNLFSFPSCEKAFQSSAIYLESLEDYKSVSKRLKNFKQKNDKEAKNISINFQNFTKLTDFYKFDDILQTILIDHSKNFVEIRIVIDYEDNLAIFCLLKFLLLINSCNIFTLEFGYSGSYSSSQQNEQTFDRINKVSMMLERVFFQTLSIKHLQQLSIQMNTNIFPFFCSGIKRITDPSKLNLRQFYLSGDLQKAHTNNIAECIEFFSRIPSLYAFKSDTIVISGKESVEQFHALIKNIQSISFKLEDIPRDFTFKLPVSNLIEFEALLGFTSMQFNENLLDQLLNSMKSAKNLAIFKLTIWTIVNHHTSRSNIMSRSQKQKEREKKTREEDSNKVQTSLLLFQNLIDLPNLKQINIVCDISESIYDSILKLLEKNSTILEITLRFVKPIIRFNYRNIFSIINNCKNLKNFQLITQNSIQFAYRFRSKMSQSEYFFECEDRQIFDCLTKKQSEFNPANFGFNNVTSINLKLNLSYFEEIENIFESLEHTPNLVSIGVSAAPRQTLSEELQKNPKSYPMFRFFNRLENLQYLKHIDFDIFINQQVLNSLESFLRKSVTLKSIFFTRQFSNQFYLDYTGVFRAISASKSIEQIYWNANIENMVVCSQANIKKWEEVKLANFYEPLANLYRNSSSQLVIIEIHERKVNDAGLNLLLEGIIASSHQIYTKFSPDFIEQFDQIKNEYTKSLISNASQAGHLVDPLYEFPFYQTHFYEE